MKLEVSTSLDLSDSPLTARVLREMHEVREDAAEFNRQIKRFAASLDRSISSARARFSAIKERLSSVIPDTHRFQAKTRESLRESLVEIVQGASRRRLERALTCDPEVDEFLQSFAAKLHTNATISASHDVDDIVSELRMVIIENMDGYDVLRGKPIAYIQKIARTRGVVFLQRETAQKRAPREQVQSLCVRTVDEKYESRELGRIDRRFRELEIAEGMQAAVSTLPEDLQECVCALSDLSLREAARRSGMTRDRITAARDLLRAECQRQDLQDFL